MITSDTLAIAARKKAQAFHTSHGIRSINDLVPHQLSWSDLNAVEKDARKAATAVLDRITDKSTAEDRQACEDAADGFGDLLTAIRAEKDERSFTGSKEPRKEAATSAQLTRRPEYETGSTSDDAPAVAEIALRSDQSMRSWAEARGSRPDHLRGMNAGQFLRAMVVHDKTDAERRALAEATDAAGGVTVPDILSSELIDAARAESVLVRAGARTVPLTSDRNTIARVLTDPVPAWRLEGGAVAESDPTFGPVLLTPRSLAVKIDVSAELMADSLNLATALPQVLSSAMAVELDRVGLIGTGTNPEPEGIANTSGIGTFAQDGLISNYANLSRARTGILTANRGPVSAFVMHPRDEGSFVDRTDTDGQPLMAPRAIAEIPMLTTTSLPIDGGTGSDESTIIAGNFAHLLIGIRSAIQVEVLKGPAYVSNLQYTMLCHMRADIAVADPAAFYTLTGVGRAA